MNILQSDIPPIAERRFTLATDLDGTFLGGSKEVRRVLYDWIENNRATVGLIFVTGRDPQFIMEMCRANELPWPEYVVGDVGTTIAEVGPDGMIKPIAPLERAIAAQWNDAGPKVRSTLEGHPGLALQSTRFRYRVSYDLDMDSFDGSAKSKIDALGLDWLISDDRYFDVLPKGISKGPSIKRLIQHLGISAQRVLCAGDTVNDHSMLASGLQSVAVGNSEPALIELLEGIESVHFAAAHGAGGILEAIAAFNLHDLPKEN